MGIPSQKEKAKPREGVQWELGWPLQGHLGYSKLWEMQLERAWGIPRTTWVQSKEFTPKLDINPYVLHLFFHSFNKNALHAKPLPGAVPWVLGTQWENFCPHEASVTSGEQECHGEVGSAA